MKHVLGIAAAVVLVGLATSAGATTITADEYGTGLNGATGGRLAINNGPYTTSNPLTYTLPWTVTSSGFIQLCEAGGCNGNNPESDIIQFTGSSLRFWSETRQNDPAEPGVLADTGLPSNAQNALNLTEVDLSSLGAGFSGFSYTPTSNQPGFVTGQTNTYVLVSEGRLAVPEPATLVILGTALAGLGLLRRRRDRA